MLSSNYYIFTKRRSFVQRHPLGVVLGAALLVASAVHFLVVDLAAQDHGSYGRQHVRFAFAQPGFRTYLASKAAWERQNAISRVLTRSNHSNTSPTVQRVVPVTNVRDAKDFVVEPSSRTMQVRSAAAGAVARDSENRPSHRQPLQPVVSAAVEHREGDSRSTSGPGGALMTSEVTPATQIGREASINEARSSLAGRSPRRARARKVHVRTNPKVAKQKLISGLPVWAYRALFRTDG